MGKPRRRSNSPVIAVRVPQTLSVHEASQAVSAVGYVGGPVGSRKHPALITCAAIFGCRPAPKRSGTRWRGVKVRYGAGAAPSRPFPPRHPHGSITRWSRWGSGRPSRRSLHRAGVEGARPCL